MINNNDQNEINKIRELINTSLEPYYKLINSPAYKHIININNKIKDTLSNIKLSIPKTPNFKVNDAVLQINKCMTTLNNTIPIIFDLQPIGNIICPIEIKIIEGNDVVDCINGYFILNKNN